VLDFDGDFSMADIADIAADARAKSLEQIVHDIDSIKEFNDSVGHAYYADALRYTYRHPQISQNDSIKAMREVTSGKVNYDTIFSKLSSRTKQQVVTNAMSAIRMQMTDLEYKGEYAEYLFRRLRMHQIEAIGKFTLALSCIIFFFIGAPLGAIIRKGGLGVPVIVSVLVFIVYFIFENSGMKMARDDQWTVWFGKLISTVVLTPIAVFFTYKANNDSVVFNIDLYKNFFMKLLGLRQKRHIFRKEVIIEDPKYQEDAEKLLALNQDIYRYTKEHKLLHWPSPIKVFFHAGDDQEMETISDRLEELIEDLGYTKDKIILSELNHYPVLAATAHTRPFRKKWLNIIAGLIIPLGIFLYIRMLRFRMRLYRDLRTIRHTSDHIVERINNM
jgi:lipopolysaccharide export system permease protein